jgi:hypothetical protein
MTRGFKEKSAQYRAVVKNRRTMSARGLARFEVRGLAKDRELVRSVAKKLASDSEQATALRTLLERETAPAPITGREIVERLRNSPLADVDWYTKRPFDPGRKIDL